MHASTSIAEAMTCVAVIAAVVTGITAVTDGRPELRIAISVVGILVCLAIGW
jgi:type IV secretory pathway VirB2 component (pilin)